MLKPEALKCLLLFPRISLNLVQSVSWLVPGRWYVHTSAAGSCALPSAVFSLFLSHKVCSASLTETYLDILEDYFSATAVQIGYTVNLVGLYEFSAMSILQHDTNVIA